jgi:hypothetical protein
VLADRTEQLEQALRVSGRLTPSPGALALPHRLMGVLRAVVQAVVLPRLRARENVLEAGPSPPSVSVTATRGSSR